MSHECFFFFLKRYWPCSISRRCMVFSRGNHICGLFLTGSSCSDHQFGSDNICYRQLDDRNHSSSRCCPRISGLYNLRFGRRLNSFDPNAFVWFTYRLRNCRRYHASSACSPDDSLCTRPMCCPSWLLVALVGSQVQGLYQWYFR